MCGIFGVFFWGHPILRRALAAVLLSGLRRLEYRGYDSAGICLPGLPPSPSPGIQAAPSPFQVIRSVGNVEALAATVARTLEGSDESLTAAVGSGIAHTRWATHGAVTCANAHPLASGPGQGFVLVHNGTITNADKLRRLLVEAGHSFQSETDTEVLAVLMAYMHARLAAAAPPFPAVVRAALSCVVGTYALAVVSRHYPRQMVMAVLGSSLLLGLPPDYAPQATDLPSSSASRDAPSPEPPSESVTSPEAPTPPNHPSPSAPAPVTTLPAAFYLASDPAALAGRVQHVVRIADFDLCHLWVGAGADPGAHPSGGGRRRGQYTLTRLQPPASHWARNPGLSQLQVVSPPAAPPPTTRAVEELSLALEALDRGSFSTFMEKEIYEQAEVVRRAAAGRLMPNGALRLGGLGPRVAGRLGAARRVLLIACGTSYHAGLAIAPTLERLAGVPTQAWIATVFLDHQTRITPQDTCIFISQSGETRDVIASLAFCRAGGAQCLGVVNRTGALLARRVDGGVYLRAGLEVGVASTKAYTAQIIVMLLIGLAAAAAAREHPRAVGELGAGRGGGDGSGGGGNDGGVRDSDDAAPTTAVSVRIAAQLQALPGHVSATLATSRPLVAAFADQVYRRPSMVFLGRGRDYPTAIEGALKCKEISYMHCEGFPAGELKHGALALIDNHMPVILVISAVTAHRDASITALAEIRSRAPKGRILIVLEADDTLEDAVRAALHHPGQPKDPNPGAGPPPTLVFVPSVGPELQPTANILPLQLLALLVAQRRGLNVDRPRNLAKSVTVG